MELSNYLLPTHSVEITVSIRDEMNKASDLILKTIIESEYVEGTFKVFAPVYHGKVYNFLSNETVMVTFSSPDATSKEIYTMRCKVLHKTFENNTSLVTLKTTSPPVKVQRRQAFRVNIYNTYSFRYRNAQYELITKDISSTGILGLTTVQFKTGDQFEIRFDANIKPKDALFAEYSELKVFNIKCRILDSMPQTEIRKYLNRIQFFGMSEQESKYLIQYLYAKQSEMIHIDPNSSQKIQSYFENSGGADSIPPSNNINKIQILGLVNYFLLFISIVMLLFARPKQMYVLDYFFDFYRPQFWDARYLFGAFIASLIVMFISFIGILINLRDVAQKKDRLHMSVVTTSVLATIIVAVIGIIASVNQLSLF